MTEHHSQVFIDDAVASAVLDIVRGARDHVILVSPYNKFWDHLRDEIRLALGRGVRMIYVYRDGEESDDIAWLGQQGVTLYAVDKLHAKLFLNESSVIVTSMNMHEASSKNSKEIALLLNDPAAKREVRSYVQERLIRLGRQIRPSSRTAEERVAGHVADRLRSSTVGSKPKPTPAPSARNPAKPAKSAPKPSLGKILRSVASAIVGGTCIRCKTRIKYDPSHPLCDSCFRSWNKHKNPGFPEKVCHRCSRTHATSYAKPLCYSCYQETNK